MNYSFNHYLLTLSYGHIHSWQHCSNSRNIALGQDFKTTHFLLKTWLFASLWQSFVNFPFHAMQKMWISEQIIDNLNSSSKMPLPLSNSMEPWRKFQHWGRGPPRLSTSANFFLLSESWLHTLLRWNAQSVYLGGLPCQGGDNKQWTVSQYANDSSFMIKGDRQFVNELVRLLKMFTEALGMEIN